MPSGVVALAGLDEDANCHGMAMSTFVPVSIDPPIVAISVQETSRTWTRLRKLPALGVSVLTHDHGPLARQLAGPEAERFRGVATVASPSGAVHIDGCGTRFECTVIDEIVAGDHLIVTLSVEALTPPGADDAGPLIFHRSTFGALASS
ncbi:flavin reductase family protein [Streptomyces chartreusis]|uniref:flavin reductase family protein n=1 Tax=Streptomyces chartreusis TaxID=1969 RepID=UPI0036309B95